MRYRVAQILATDPEQLWPHTATDSRLRDDRRELSGIFARADDVRAPDWKALLGQATDTIELLDTTLIRHRRRARDRRPARN